jgi:MoxR-like ATPase
MATLNPIEMEGTYPLPEAQLDRFLFKVRLDYPEEDNLVRIISSTTGADEAGIVPVFPGDEAPERLEELKKLVREVIAAPAMEHYAARIVRATQPDHSRYVGDSVKSLHDEMVNRYVMFGSSPRGAQALILGGKVRALLDGRANVAREDIEAVAVSALAHRIMLNYAAHSDGIDAPQIVERVIRSVRAARS